MENSLPPKAVISQMILGFMTTKAIHVAARYDIADLIAANGPMNSASIAAKCGAHEESLHRLLRALASVGIFSEDSEGNFSLTPMAECLTEDSADSVKAMALLTASLFYKAYEEFPYSVQTGEAGFKKAIGMSIFEYLMHHSSEGKIFDRMMTDFHGTETMPMIEAYDFSVFKTVIDVGGGIGEVIAAILTRFPQAEGILFDTPEVISRSRDQIAARGLSDRCQLEEGNFFESVPPGGDAYLLRHIIHDWNDEDAATILSNCRNAMGPAGKVLVVEAVIQEGNDPSPFKWLDLSMLMIGGKERSRQQFEQLLSKAGLQLNRIIPFLHDLCVVEAIVK
jgi:hypothetical protein